MLSVRFIREKNQIKQIKYKSIPPSVGVCLEGRLENSVFDISVL